jgi:hypothetical protein
LPDGIPRLKKTYLADNSTYEKCIPINWNFNSIVRVVIRGKQGTGLNGIHKYCTIIKKLINDQ